MLRHPVLLIALCLSPSVAFAQTRYEPVSLYLAEGDPAAGREAFVELRCTACHPVAGDQDLPAPVSAARGPQLGSAAGPTDVDRLASSIASPSHLISSSISEETKQRLTGVLSPMGDFSSVMTVRQLSDLVAYLREEFPTMVNLTMEASMEGDALAIEGTADLPDGALVGYEVRHDRLPWDTETPEWMLFTEGIIEVLDGTFETVVDTSLLDSGRFEVYVAFRPDLPGGIRQPTPIREQFGEQGEKLHGPNVVLDGNQRSIRVTRNVTR